jgi:hypothetical protein
MIKFDNDDDIDGINSEIKIEGITVFIGYTIYIDFMIFRICQMLKSPNQSPKKLLTKIAKY